MGGEICLHRPNFVKLQGLKRLPIICGLGGHMQTWDLTTVYTQVATPEVADLGCDGPGECEELRPALSVLRLETWRRQPDTAWLYRSQRQVCRKEERRGGPRRCVAFTNHCGALSAAPSTVLVEQSGFPLCPSSICGL